MMSNEEMVRNVFRRTDEYFQKKEKRNNTIKKGASFMSLFSIITLAGLGLWSSNIQSPVLPDEPSKIAIVQTNYETTATTVYSETNNTVTTAAASVSSSPVSGTSDLTQTDNTTADTEVVTTAPVNIQTTAGITSTVTVTVTETATNTTVSETTSATDTTVTELVTSTTTVTTTTTALPETEPSPAATDLDKTINNVVSVGDDFITVEIFNIDYDYMTFYNRKANYSYVYMWRHEAVDFYVITADSSEELASIVLPEGVESVDIEYMRENDSWEYIDERTIISELTDPYLVVRGAEPEVLYQIDGVKDVYAVDAYTSKSADIYTKTKVSILTSVLDRELTIEDFAGIDGITAVTMGSKSQYSEQMVYSIEFENANKSDTRVFDICRSLVELETVDCAYPLTMFNLMYYYPSYVVDLVENPYTEDEEKTEVPITGDIDGNGTVDISDATAVLSIYAESAAGITPAIYTSAASNPADVNGDGVVSLDDATAILLYYAQAASGLSPEWADIINK